MRKREDLRPDHEVKRACIEVVQISEAADSVVVIFIAAIDDDYSGKLKLMYESLGIPCFTSFADFFATRFGMKTCKANSEF